MERLTTNKPVSEMGIVDLAYNCCFAKDGEAFYKDFNKEISLRDFIRTLYKNHLGINIPEGVEAFDDYIITDLEFGPDFDVDGVIAFLYHMMWSKSDLYERLKRYEDLEEQGLLLKLPYPLGTQKLYWVEDYEIYELRAKEITFLKADKFAIRPYEIVICVDDYDFYYDDFGKTVFLTREEAEKALAEMEKKNG